MNHKSIKILFFIFLFLLNNHSSRTQNIDSLVNELEVAQTGVKFEIYEEIFIKLYDLGQYELELKHAQDMLQIAKEENNKQYIAQANNKIGAVYMGMGDYQKSLEYRTNALEIIKESGSKEKIAETLSGIGLCFNQIDKYQEAIEFYEKAFQINSEINNSTGMSSNLSNMGAICHEMGKHDKALEHYHEALKINEKEDNKKNEGLTLLRLGGIYYDSKEYVKALEYQQKSLSLWEEMGEKNGMVRSLNNLGNVCNDIGEKEQALEHFYRALKMNTEMGNERQISVNLHNIGRVYKDKGEYNRALDYIYQSLEITKKRDDKSTIAHSYFEIGEILFKQGKFNEAITNFKKSNEIASEIGLVPLFTSNYFKLFETYERKGKYKNALEHLKSYHLYNDSIMNSEKIMIIAELETKYETEQKEKENAILKNEIFLAEQQKEAQKNIKFLLLIGLIASIITTGFIIYNFRLRKESLQKDRALAEKNSEQYKLELEFRNRELTTNAIHLAQTNELTNNIVSEIRKLNELTNNAGKKIILNIIHSLNKKKESNALKEFEKRFENVHTMYYKNLLEKFPNLTPNEKKLCAFLRLNMTTKDISSITYQSVRAIEAGRLRLRKKLNISSDVNLVTFLSQF